MLFNGISHYFEANFELLLVCCSFGWVFCLCYFFTPFPTLSSSESCIIKYRSGIELMTLDTRHQVIESSSLRSSISCSRPTLVPLHDLTSFVWRWSTGRTNFWSIGNWFSSRIFYLNDNIFWAKNFGPKHVQSLVLSGKILPCRIFLMCFNCLGGFLFNFLPLPPQQTIKTIVFLFLCLAQNPRNSKITFSEKQQKWVFINCEE